jgi:site-specific DNA recombinase
VSESFRAALYARVSTEYRQSPEDSIAWQRAAATALIENHGGRIVTEYLDVGVSRSLPWSRRPQAARLLGDCARPDRGFEAIVIGEPQRAFAGTQFALTFPVFVHHGVELWVPEVGGRVDPDSEAHDLVMSLLVGDRPDLRSHGASGAHAKVARPRLLASPPQQRLRRDSRTDEFQVAATSTHRASGVPSPPGPVW